MRTSRDARDMRRLGRRQFLSHVLAAGAGTLAAPAATLLRHAGAWTAIAGAASTPPALPGAPPDKQNTGGITVPANDPRIVAGPAEYQGTITPLRGYLSQPAGVETYPGVLVIHDALGLTEHIRDVTRRLARAGYVALAPDLLSRMGGTEKLGEPAKIAAALATLSMGQYLQDLNASVSYLESRPLAAKTRVGVLGFGLGGNLAWALVAQNADLKAGVMLYGGFPPTSVLPRLKAAMLAIFAETDRQDPSDVTELDQAMKKAGLPWSYKTEPKAGRGFFDDTRNRYVPAAAKDAWQMTLDWFGQHLST